MDNRNITCKTGQHFASFLVFKEKRVFYVELQEETPNIVKIVQFVKLRTWFWGPPFDK